MNSYMDHETEMEIDEGYASTMSTMATDAGSIDTANTTSVKHYVYENGRTYHRLGEEGGYPMPNDKIEQDRLDLQHHLHMLILSGKLHLAPVEDPQRVLDCGTGTGIWALDFGEIHPASEVYGVDISPIQPSWMYSNVRFETDDLEKEWLWPENYFDLIHSRDMTNGIHDFATYIQQMYRHTKPGGWIEISEIQHELKCPDNTSEGSLIREWADLFLGASKQLGQKYPDVGDLMTYMKDAGFEDITLKTYVVPWGTWTKSKRLKEIGAVMGSILESGFEAYGLQLVTRAFGCSSTEYLQFIEEVKKELRSNRVHSYTTNIHIIARKPVMKEEDARI